MTITLNPFSLRVKETAYSFSEMMLVFSVFSKELGSINIFGVDFDLISYPFFVLFFISHLPQMLGSRQQPFVLYFYLIVSSLVSILLLGLQAGGFLKQFLPIVVIFSTMFVLVQKENIVRIFHLYIIIAYYTAIFGIIQVLLSFGGINILIKIPGRLDSIAYEPSHYASILVPALVFAFFNFSYYRKQFFVMLTALFFTFNVTGYVVFLLILSVAFINPIYIIFSVPVIYVVLFYYLPAINPYFNMRFIDTLEVIQGRKDIFRSRLTVNGTTLSFFSNLDVAFYTMKKSLLTGSGLGGHEEMYYRRFEYDSFRYNYYYGLNAKSGHSLSIRILSEFGILGFGLYLFTLIKNVLFFKSKVPKAIALACLSHFLCKTLKLGGYIDYGTPFFLCMLILNARYFQSKIK